MLTLALCRVVIPLPSGEEREGSPGSIYMVFDVGKMQQFIDMLGVSPLPQFHQGSEDELWKTSMSSAQASEKRGNPTPNPPQTGPH